MTQQTNTFRQSPARRAAPWRSLCSLADLEPFWGEAALVAGTQIALFRTGPARVHAVAHRDPVSGAHVIARGILGSRGGRTTVASPLFKEVYDLETGECLDNADLSLAVFPTRIVDGTLQVAVPTPGPPRRPRVTSLPRMGRMGSATTGPPASGNRRHMPHDRCGILVACSHGTDSPAGKHAIARLGDAVDARLGGGVVRAFVDVQRPSLPQALADLDGPEAVVVPLLLSAGYHVHVDMAQAVAARPGTRLAPALGPDERLVDVLCARLKSAGLPRTASVVLAAAGSSDARAVADCRRTATMLARRLGRPVGCGFLSAATPSVKTAVAAQRATRPGAKVFVATSLLAPGYFSGLLGGCGPDFVTPPLLVPGEPPSRTIVDLVVDRYLAAREANTAQTMTAIGTKSA